MCNACGHDCRGEQNRRMTAIAAMIALFAPAAAPAVNAYVESNTRTNEKLNEIEASGREITDDDLSTLGATESAYLRKVFETVPTSEHEEAARQMQGLAKDLKEIQGSLKAFIRQRYEEGDRTMSTDAQEGIAAAVEYEKNLNTTAGKIADSILDALKGGRVVEVQTVGISRDPENGKPIMPGTPAGTTC